jgi:hypothetical protein
MMSPKELKRTWGCCSLVPIQHLDLKVDLAVEWLEPNFGAKHFFVNVDKTNLNVEEKAAGLNSEVSKP